MNIVITQQQINETVIWDGLKEFGLFILSYCNDGSLPDYKKMDLMQISHLVPNIWVYDLRKYENDGRFQINFCGESINRSWGFHLKDYFDRDILQNRNDKETVNRKTESNIKAINNHSVSYKKINEQIVYKDNPRNGHLESLFFPCSSDNVSVNWGIGFAAYSSGSFDGENIYLHF